MADIVIRIWQEGGDWIAVDSRYPSCSWVAGSPEKALRGIRKLVRRMDADIARTEPLKRLADGDVGTDMAERRAAQTVAAWRALPASEKLRIRHGVVLARVAASMAMEGQPVSAEWLARQKALRIAREVTAQNAELLKRLDG